MSKLRKDVDANEYEKWIREYDYPTCKKYFKSIKSYIAYKVTEAGQEKYPYDYIEHIELTSKREYEEDKKSPKFKELIEQWSKYVEKALMLYAVPVE